MILLETSSGPTQNGLGLPSNTTSGDAGAFAAILQGISTQEEGESPALAQLLNAVREGRLSLQQALQSDLVSDEETASPAILKSSTGELEALTTGLQLTEENLDALGIVHPKIGQTLQPDQLIALIQDAKAYLKGRIAELAPSEQPPQTLKGLVDLARNIGIDLSSVTIEEIAGNGSKPSYLEALNARQPFFNPVALERQNALAQQQKETTPLNQLLQRTSQTDQTNSQESASKTDGTTKLGDAKLFATDDTAGTSNAKVTAETTGLSQLLHGDAAENTGDSDAIRPIGESVTKEVSSSAALKENLDLKINEAKQTLRHFASSLNDAVENYKPPFTRIKIQLNPVKLGEVDVTMVQRGNNLHINISSNSTAITTLTQNATELRTQLSQNGLGNATMNFNSNTDAQQQHHAHQEMLERYAAFDSDEASDVIERFEIIVPRYV